MRNTLIAAAAFSLMAVPAFGQQLQEDYDWEDGNTIVGEYTGGADNLISENSTEQAHGGVASLKLTEDPLDGTPQAYVAYIENLVDGDTITAGFWVYDTTPGTSPSGRIWASYADSGDNDDCLIDSYRGSASGNGDYSDGTGWSYLEYTWIFEAGDPVRDALIIQTRVYSDETGNIIYVDDLSVYVDSASGIAKITHPGNNPCDGPSYYHLEVTDLVGGGNGYFTVTGATPDTNQYLVYSLQGLGSTYVPQLDVTLDLAAPKLGASGTSDADGDMLWSLSVPGAGSGHTVWLQCAEYQNTTNVVEEFID